MKKEKTVTETIINEKQILAVCNQLYGNNIKLEIPKENTIWNIYIPLEIIKKEKI